MVAPTTMNGASRITAMTSTMVSAAIDACPFMRASSRWYNGHAVVHRIAAQTSAVMNGFSTRKHPMMSSARTTSVKVWSIREGGVGGIGWRARRVAHLSVRAAVPAPAEPRQRT